MYCYNCMKQLEEGMMFCPFCGGSTTPEDIPHHLLPGTVLQNKYLVGNSIGEGGFGITYVGLDINLKLKIAIKEFYPNGYANRNNKVTNRVTLNYQKEGEYFKNGREQFLREAQSLAKFSEENGIVDVRDYFTENDTAYIIMEYVDGETLSERIRKRGVFESSEMFRMMLPIMRSLKKMHSENIIHRDISPDNIKVTEDGSFKLLDFGSARYFSGAQKKTMSVMLKPGFAPFEQYSNENDQGPWTDVYGLCATIYKCITDKTPATSLNRTQNDPLKKPSELGITISEALQNVLMYGLAVYPENRCPDMNRLIELTEAALQNGNVHVNENKRVEEDINRTRKADEQYKTMFADGKNYNDSYYFNSDYINRGSVGEEAANNDLQLQIKKTDPPKTNKVLIALLIVLSVLVIAAIGAVTAFVIVSDDSSDKKKETTVASDTVSDGDNNDSEDSGDDKSDEEENKKMVDVTGKKLSDAIEEIDNLGIKAVTTEKYSSTVAEGFVISQNIKPGESVQRGDTVDLVVSKGKAVNDAPYNQKVVVTADSGSSYGTMNVLNWEDGEWVSKFSCSATVGKGGISSDNSESNTLTPKGSFRLGVVLTASGVSTNMQTKLVNSGTVVCDDVRYPEYYNQIFNSLPSGVSGDPIGKKLTNGQNNALIFIEHNGNGFSSSGVSIYNSSVITICGCYNSIAPTGGCIDISASDMNTLLGVLDSSKNPYIITEVE